MSLVWPILHHGTNVFLVTNKEIHVLEIDLAIDITMQPMQKHVIISKWCSKKMWNKTQKPTYLFQKLGHSNWKEELYMKDTIGKKEGKPILGLYHLEHCTPNFWNPFNFKTTWDSFKEDFISNFISQDYPNHVIWNFNWLYKILILVFEMNGQGKCFKKVTL